MVNTSFLNKTQLKIKKKYFFILLGQTWFNAFLALINLVGLTFISNWMKINLIKINQLNRLIYELIKIRIKLNLILKKLNQNFIF
jgi:hypothetical protein